VYCVLIFNPASGRRRDRRLAQLNQVAEALSALGHRVKVATTSEPGSATVQASQAVAAGADVVFACGGDGTVHEVLQAVVSEDGEPASALGIIPFGSANALARHLRLSLDPCEAALEQINGEPCSIPVGKLTYGGRVRYFTVMAGAGPDGALVCNMLTAHKSRLGRLAYYLRAACLFFTQRFRKFEIEFIPVDGSASMRCQAVSAMAVRVDNLGGLFSKLARGEAAFHDLHLRLFIISPPAAISLPLWFISGWLNMHALNPFLRCVDAAAFNCRSIDGMPIHVEADGEWLGRLPVQVSLAPASLRILLPTNEVRLAAKA